MSSSRKSAKSANNPRASFQLKDLDSETTTPARKVLKDTPSSSAKITTTRSKAAEKRNRAADDEEDLEGQFHLKMAECISFVRTYVERVNASHEQETSELKTGIYEFKATVAIKDKLIRDLHRDLDSMAKKLAEKDAFADEQIKDIIQSAKDSARRTILESRIKMDGEVGELGFVIPSWDVEAWKKTFAEFDNDDEEAEDDLVEVTAVDVGGSKAKEQEEMVVEVDEAVVEKK